MGGHSFFGGGGGGYHHHHDRIHYSPNAPVVVAPTPVVIVPTYYPTRRVYVDNEPITTTTTTTTVYNTDNSPNNLQPPNTNNPPPYNPAYVNQQKQESSRRCTSITFQVILVICMVIYAVVMGLKVPKQTSIEIDLGLSETRVFDINSVWYSDIRTGKVNFTDDPEYMMVGDDRSSDVSLLAFDKMPPISASDSWTYISTVSIAPGDYTYLSWYFYTGSTLKATWSSADMPNLQLVIVKSLTGYNLFYNGDDEYENYVVYAEVIDNGDICNVYLTVNSNDFYFLIYTSSNYNPIFDTPIEYSINTTLLDTSNSKRNCTLPCEISVGYQSHEVYVFQTPLVSQYTRGTPNTVYTLYPTKVSRTWVISIVFSLPLGFMVVVFIALMKCSCASASNDYEKMRLNGGIN